MEEYAINTRDTWKENISAWTVIGILPAYWMLPEATSRKYGGRDTATKAARFN